MKAQLPPYGLLLYYKRVLCTSKANSKGLNDIVVSALIYLQWAVNTIAKKQSVIILSCVPFARIMTHEVAA